ncbi:Protein O-mannosyltransferase 2 [Spiromyces aspiralis]|uniref:Protein O-mannosyltransferase 2 n=1 Tax=Spiromyces aspiralis TaxID=68401 RepID=A0ACC1HHN8_9FUNG|nr:Protein O-mannosyltransferase 2 [Spiromyces aspiralis]
MQGTRTMPNTQQQRMPLFSETDYNNGSNDDLPDSTGDINPSNPQEGDQTAPQTRRIFDAYPVEDKRPATMTKASQAWCACDVDGVVSAVLLTVSAFTRLYKIGERDQVTWDETHFGKFGTYYIRRRFYHDVHPPLAKMIVALAEILSGHDGSFNYKLGKEYTETVNYVFQRSFVAMFGIALVPLAYLTCLSLGMSRQVAVLGALFVLLDNALCVISRFILLDPPLLFFTALVLHAFTKFRQLRDAPFTGKWWMWLLLTGVSLGAVLSSKWVGLFCVALVGVQSAEDVFAEFSRQDLTWRRYACHWVARLTAFLGIPLAIYLACFALHFTILDETGTGDSKMPSAFQTRIWRNVVAKQPKSLAYGSRLTLKSHAVGIGVMSAQVVPDVDYQNRTEIVMYRFKNQTNHLTIVRANEAANTAATEDPPQYVGAHDTFRLMTAANNLTLGVNRTYWSPVMPNAWRVSLRPANEAGAGNMWKFEVVRQLEGGPYDAVNSVSTEFMIRHAETSCLLYATGDHVERAGDDLTEVACVQDKGQKRTTGYVWNIEQIIDERLRSVSRKSVPTSFLHNVIRLNREMARTNNELTVDVDHYKDVESDPWSWPFLVYPMRLTSWSDISVKYYEIGNPLLWWSTAALCLVVWPAKVLVYFVGYRRGRSDWPPYGEFLTYLDGSKLLWMGWALHYLPFFLMGRVTYIHHYLPALYFALLLLAYELDWYLRPKPTPESGAYVRRWAVVAAIGVAVTAVYAYFAPFTYGLYGPAESMKGRQWMPTWNIYKDRYPIK